MTPPTSSLRELDVFVADDLYSVAPRVEEIEKLTGQRVDAGLRQRTACASLSSTTSPK